jgi:DNA-binding MarR family transcriptional regulator
VRKRLEVLRFISGFIRDNKYCPNLRDLGKELGICQSSAYARVKRLRKNGLVDYLDNSPRTLHLTEAGEYMVWNTSALHSEAPPSHAKYKSDIQATFDQLSAPEALERKNVAIVHLDGSPCDCPEPKTGITISFPEPSP